MKRSRTPGMDRPIPAWRRPTPSPFRRYRSARGAAALSRTATVKGCCETLQVNVNARKRNARNTAIGVVCVVRAG